MTYIAWPAALSDSQSLFYGIATDLASRARSYWKSNDFKNPQTFKMQIIYPINFWFNFFP